ncbi:hypothetical protein HY491_01340 [Candidatus Woesearchaeota archaeon]|nr:hypothetical protein [Candidatus Woesearchaeota archaeon]
MILEYDGTFTSPDGRVEEVSLFREKGKRKYTLHLNGWMIGQNLTKTRLKRQFSGGKLHLVSDRSGVAERREMVASLLRSMSPARFANR